MNAAQKRIVVQDLYNKGIHERKVLSERTNIPLSTVHRVVNQIEKGEGVERKKGSGRPKIYTETDHRRLGQLVRFGPLKSVEKFRVDMLDRGSPDVCTNTVRRELKRLGWEKRRGRVSPLLSDEQKQRRLNWCLAHQNFDWNNVLFSDESSLWLYPHTVKIWTKDNVIPLFPRPKHSLKFHMWGGISARGTTPLCIFEDNLTKERYTEILEGHLLPTVQVLYPDGWIFQQDNDPKHTAGHTRQWLRDQTVTVLDWPSYSPDLNPIENVWGLLKDNLNQKGIRQIATLKAEATRYWDSLTHDLLQNLTDSMPRRIADCIALNGGLTKY